MDAERNRPVELQNPDLDQPASPALEAVIENMRQAAQAGMSPREGAQSCLMNFDSQIRQPGVEALAGAGHKEPAEALTPVKADYRF